MKTLTLEETINKALERGQKYKVSNEKLDDVVNEIEKKIISIVDESEFSSISNFIFTVNSHKYIVVPAANSVFLDASYHEMEQQDVINFGWDSNVQSELFYRVITFYDSDCYCKGTRINKINFLQDSKQLIEKIGIFLEKKSKEIEKELKEI